MAKQSAAQKLRQAQLYVISREHYHFPPNDSDMVAATAIEVHVDGVAAKIYAHRLAKQQADKYGVEVKEHNGRTEYRVWIDWEKVRETLNPDRFVWVVRACPLIG